MSDTDSEEKAAAHRAANLRWYYRHRAERLMAGAAWRAAHPNPHPKGPRLSKAPDPEAVRQKDRDRRARNIEKFRERDRNRRYTPEQKARNAASKKAWVERHRLKHRANCKKWAVGHREEHFKMQVACRLRKNYGITPERFVEMETAQGGLCAICGLPESYAGNRTNTHRKRKLSIDHDHGTGTVRGLLCHRCNLGLGNFRDDPELLKAATRYLGLSKEKTGPTSAAIGG